MQLEADFFQFKLLSSASDNEVTATQCETQILRDDLWNINDMLQTYYESSHDDRVNKKLIS